MRTLRNDLRSRRDTQISFRHCYDQAPKVAKTWPNERNRRRIHYQLLNITIYRGIHLTGIIISFPNMDELSLSFVLLKGKNYIS